MAIGSGAEGSDEGWTMTLRLSTLMRPPDETIT